MKVDEGRANNLMTTHDITTVTEYTVNRLNTCVQSLYL